MAANEAELIARGRAGDRAALAALHTAHAPRIKAYALRSGFREADADDLTQEAFLLAFRALDTFDCDRGDFAPWLNTIARNLARKRFLEPFTLQFDPELAAEVLAVRANPGGPPEMREQIDALSGCIEDLDPELANVIRLRYVDGRTTRGIADATGISEATVRLRLRDAAVLLEQCLKKKGVFS